MSVGVHALDDGRAVLVDSVTETAFPMVFDSEDRAWAFEKWLAFHDLKVLSHTDRQWLETKYDEFMKLPLVECRRCGEMTADEDGLSLCPGSCRSCEWCLTDDLTLKDCKDYGWLCERCAE